MTDKNLLEDDIIDLTDLLEEGSPPKKTDEEPVRKKVVAEPDSFDLGKEISMDFDVSIEEIEQEGPAPADELHLEREEIPQAQPVTEEVVEVRPKESLREIEAEIDLAMQETIEEVTLTKNEEEVLLSEGPVEEIPSPPVEEPQAHVEEIEQVSWDEPAPEPPSHPAQEPLGAPVEMPQAVVSPAVPPEAIVEALVSEFRKDMPALLEGIVRPVVQELLQEIISSTREALPGIVEKVIREEIERLKKL
ncbi:MAG TPA: hypothetical protein PLT09_14020, partial [Deltaproteobacteria bacterium]|nr:hypothetical protein [Deltaproteobacteria bacterium]HPR54384.1 hypothetical protein [Deltaproteobacteria bacterium]HXK48559.1 hypothetical protein [Deltaproteobacteria bacterium]